MGEGLDRRPIKGEVFLTNTEIGDILYLDKNYKKFMLVLNVGGVIDLSPVLKISNILLLSQLGSVTGDTFVDILLGKSNPSGKLSTTWGRYNDYPFYNKDTIDKILEQNEINLIPVVNEYGRKRLTQSFVCHKGNENNVDLTRNYDYDFKEIIDKKINPINGINSGRKPFSEYETRLVKEIMKKIKPNIFINTRSGNLTLTAPSDNKKKTKDLLNILDYLKNKYCEECLVGNMDKISDDTSGNSVDYAFNKRKVKYAFKFDIFNYDTTTKFNKMISKDKIDSFDFDDFEKDQSFLQIKNKKYYHIMTEEEFENKNAKYVNILKNLDNEYTIDELFFYCVLQKNPIIEKEVNNLLKFWTNVYFDLFSTIYKKENK
jgi:hypothetical protein